MLRQPWWAISDWGPRHGGGSDLTPAMSKWGFNQRQIEKNLGRKCAQSAARRPGLERVRQGADGKARPSLFSLFPVRARLPWHKRVHATSQPKKRVATS